MGNLRNIVIAVSTAAVATTGCIVTKIISKSKDNQKCKHHNYQIVGFDGVYVKVKCVNCGDIMILRYKDYLNTSNKILDVNNDGVVNKKDFDVLKKEFNIKTDNV